MATTGGGSITSYAGNAAEIVSSLSGQSSWNVRDMTANARSHKQSRDAAAVKVAASLLFSCFIVLFPTTPDRAKFCIEKVRFSKKIPPVRALPQGGNVFVLLRVVWVFCSALVLIIH